MIGLGLSVVQLAVRQLVGGFNPASLFAASEPGVWLDPSDFSTMFQDAAGTTPVTAVEQPVGLILDKSKGLVLGPELVTNGDFSNGLTGWTNTANGTMVDNGGVLQYTRGTLTGAVNQAYGDSSAVNKWYRITARCRIVSGGGSALVRLSTAGGIVFGASASVTSSAWTDVVAYGVVPSGATGVVASLLVGSPSGTVAEFDNISVRELPGNHATQTTSTSRPVLSARYNLLTKTEQFDDAVWVKNNATVTANAAVAPDGTLTADRLVTGGAGNSLKSVNQSFSAAAATYTLGIYVKDNGGVARSVDLFFATPGLTATVGTIYNFDTNTLTNLPSAGPFTLVSSSRVLVGNGWHRIEITITVSSAQSILIYAAAPYLAAQIGDYYIWGASLVPANQSSLPYQRVNTSTDYDADPSKFKPYLRFDGVDDWLVTPTITPGTDKAQVFAGVRKLSDAATGVLVESSATVAANAGSFVMAAPNNTGASGNYSIYSRGNITPSTPANSAITLAPVTSVVSGFYDISGDTMRIRVNGGGEVTNTADQGTGNYLAYPLYIGRRGGTSVPFNGHLYGLIVRFGANLPAGTISSAETWVAGKTGITL